MKNNSARLYVIWHKPKEVASDHVCNNHKGWIIYDQTDSTDAALVILAKAKVESTEALLTKRVEIKTYEVEAEL